MTRDTWPPPPPTALGFTELERLRSTEDQLRAENEHLRETVVELEQVRDTYFELYDLAAVALIALDEVGVIQKVNDAAINLLAKDRKTLIGLSLQVFVHAHDRARFGRHLLACQELTSKMADARLRLAKKHVPLRLSTRWVHAAKGAFILAALVDEGETVALAEEKQRLVEAEQRARREIESKDQFIAMLSHELRTPLTPILADCSRLEEDADLDERVRKVLSRISRNAAAEARLVDDLLDATGILRGKLNIRTGAVELHELVTECADTLRCDALAKRQTIQVDLLASRCWVDGDALRLRQVFSNLIKNAIKFTPADGAIHVRSWDGHGSIVVEVEDSGIGFEPSSSRGLFEPFEQFNEQPHAGGLGLGLAIAKGLVELHHGQIDATSRGRGQGSRFVVSLPSAPAPTCPPPSAPAVITESQPPAASQRLLLVEDHEDTAETLSELLQMNGYSVVVAHSVAGALAEDNGDIDVVISDLGLPDGTGTDLIQKLQAKRRRPAIALSGFGMDSDVRASKEAGFDVHLTKPVTAARLLAAVAGLRPAAG